MSNTPQKIIDIAAADIATAARRLLGFESLGPGQREAIESLLQGRDTLLVQPTGSGKSAVYQIAGALLDGSTVIISPLIAFQKDHADTIAPEQLRNLETLERLKAANVSLFVVNEAHGISHWSHDFRPDYLEIGRVIEALGHPPTLAMTATASRDVRTEIIERLGLRNPRVLVHGFDRPNISLRVDMFSTREEKCEALLRRVEFADKPGIVYAATHKNAEEIAADLHRLGVPAAFYHGGIKGKDRDEIQNRFMSGDIPVIVATCAFGMGVDKPDIRFVYHADVSESLDSYYQEMGRAGRDGEPAEAVLFYRQQDISAQSFKTGNGHVDSAALEAVYGALAGRRSPMAREELSGETKLSPRKLVGVLQKLEDAGAAKHLESGEIEATSDRPLNEIIEAADQRQQFQKELRKRRLIQMQGYAECRSCRREYLLRYFGDETTGPCGNCDRCDQAGRLRTAA